MNTSPSTNGTAAAAAPAPEPRMSPLLEEITDRTSDKYKLGLEPRTQDEAWNIAEAAVAAKLVESIDEAFARIQIGRPLGIPAMASIQNIVLIESKKTGLRVACMYSRMKLALCLSRPDLIEYVQPESLSNTEAVFVGKRLKGKEVRIKFTIEDAKLAELDKRGDTYLKHPGPMLQWRACGRLCDLVAPDILSGIATREEIEDEFAAQRAELEELAAAAGRGDLTRTLDAPPQAKPARDFSAEGEALKKQLTDAIAGKSKPAMAAFRKAYDAFKADAPMEASDEVQRFYSVEVGKARKADRPDSASAVAPPPAVAAQVHAGPPSAPAAATPATSGYLPPNQRGDSYDGPEDPLS